MSQVSTNPGSNMPPVPAWVSEPDVQGDGFELPIQDIALQLPVASSWDGFSHLQMLALNGDFGQDISGQVRVDAVRWLLCRQRHALQPTAECMRSATQASGAVMSAHGESVLVMMLPTVCNTTQGKHSAGQSTAACKHTPPPHRSSRAPWAQGSQRLTAHVLVSAKSDRVQAAHTAGCKDMRVRTSQEAGTLQKQAL